MELALLSSDSLEFPPTELALDEPNGLLAVGGDLSQARLIEAYRRGIFPWFEEGQPILWWSPCPRMVLFPERAHCSKSMDKWLRKSRCRVFIDRDFAGVMERCSGPRAKADGTWITAAMKSAYHRLHNQGLAHSIEVYDEEELVGGLYGVSIGGIFYGESMFSDAPNSSKMALLYLASYLRRRGLSLIDCQVPSSHLFSLGAEELSRSKFESILAVETCQSKYEQLQPAWQQSINRVVSRDGYLLD